MHPASRILIYLIAALVIPGLSFFWGGVLLCAALVLVVHAHRQTQNQANGQANGLPNRQPWRLLWRTRWLLLVMLLGYGYSLPGDPIWRALGDWSPSIQGLELGGQRAFHLVVLLLWLDWLVLRLSAEDLLTGLYALMSPLRGLRIDVTRAALRLALTLKAVEDMERPTSLKAGNLQRLFSSPPDMQLPDVQFPDHVQLRQQPIGMWDAVLPVVVLVGAMWFWIQGGAG